MIAHLRRLWMCSTVGHSNFGKVDKLSVTKLIAL